MKWLSVSFNCSNPSLSPLLTICSSSFHIAARLCVTAVSQMSGILPQPAASWVEVEHLRWFTLFYSFTHTNTHWIVWPWDYRWLSVFQASESGCVWDNNANNIITFTSYWRQPAVYRKKRLKSNYWPLVCFRKHWQECVCASQWKSGIWNSSFLMTCSTVWCWCVRVLILEVEESKIMKWRADLADRACFVFSRRYDNTTCESWLKTDDPFGTYSCYVLINNIP